MSDFVLKYADPRGEVHSQTAQGTSAQEIRERYTQQGFLVYSVKPKSAGLSLTGEIAIPGRRRRLNLEKFLIFNQQFVTLIRAGLPILKSLDLLAERLTDPKLTPTSTRCAKTCAKASCYPRLSGCREFSRRSMSPQ